ncbi:hypothetical protein [Bradyrhizobium sp. 76]|uniref:hypothetical protein n=1 Tax=Bradyrhizobium sp. 76 TaxID=2782680 RepID=UPI001FF9A1AE|nr:hypothetical protein [Bradyrhizobium sp. 76]
MTELIIFDSDGVLVDSEIIALTVLAKAASEEGAAIGVQEAIRSFRGLTMAYEQLSAGWAETFVKPSLTTSDDQPHWRLMPN